jgi:DNA-binding cell septation regulator SpoVG
MVPAVQDVRMITAKASDRAAGVVGFVTATIGELVVEGITIRRGLTGELRLGFPRHTDRYGRTHAVVRPADDAVRRELTRAIFDALGLSAAAMACREAQGEAGP